MSASPPTLASTAGIAVGHRVGDDLGGYRLVRRLGAGDHADVHLAVPITGGAPVAIVIPRQQSPDAQIFMRAEALWRARGMHTVELMDAIDRDGEAPALVLQWIPTALTTLLRSAGGVSTPATATVLLPIAATLRRIHAAGVAHGRIGPAAIRLDERGTPVLVGFGHATMFAPGASAATLAGTPAVIDDVRAFRDLAIAMMGTGAASTDVRRSLDEQLAGLPAGADLDADPHGWLDAFEARVFADVIPGPVPIPAGDGSIVAVADTSLAHTSLARTSLTDTDVADTDVADALRWHRERPPTRTPQPTRTQPPTRTRPPRRRRASALAGILDDVGGRAQVWAAGRLPDGVAASITPTVRAFAAKVGPIRARAWVPAVFVALMLIAAIVIVPAGGGEATTDGVSSAPPEVEESTEREAESTESVVETLPDADADADAGAETVTAGDPEVAAVMLLERRARCLQTRDADCVASVVQAGSPAESADLVALADAENSTAADGSAAEGSLAEGSAPQGATWKPQSAVLVDLLGGAALVDVVVQTEAGLGSVPVLLVLSGAQWRIRAILAEPAALP